ncbi:MFS transporter [Azospirillum sp. B510]|uniref:MFS transporter n=1 Tax=Azospirillum sp. (strain B510) TaxID=137722 RepID=UPI001FFE4711|nr:MFS transporter [Azospirillum sp. B510]
MAIAVAAMAAAAGLLSPSLLRAAGATPLRALTMVAAAVLVFGAASLPSLVGRLPDGAAQDFLSDAAVLLAVCLLLVFEGLLLLATRRRPGETGGGTAAVGAMRAALFLFMLAEELSRSFLPLYARDLYIPVAGLSDTLMMGLPIGLFMALVAVFTPFAGAWADRFGSRRTLMLGSLPAVAGFAGTAMAGSLAELLLWRGACALGYAVMFIAAQGFIARHTPADRRARGMAQFVAAVIVAGLCGAPLGGILADQFGYRATFAVSALLVLVAVAAVTLLPADRQGDRAQRRRVRMGDVRALLANSRFLALLLFSSVPTKLMLTGYLFYLVPVSLHAAGETPAGIGRLMMIYGLMIVLLGPWVSRMADRTGRHAFFAGLGGLVGGAGTLAILQEPGVPGLLIGIAALGIAHALNNATQLALVPEVCRADCARIGDSSVFAVYRLLERGGSAVGPLLAAALADRFGIQAALVALGLLGMLCGAAFCAVFLLASSSPSAAEGAAR